MRGGGREQMREQMRVIVQGTVHCQGACKSSEVCKSKQGTCTRMQWCCVNQVEIWMANRTSLLGEHTSEWVGEGGREIGWRHTSVVDDSNQFGLSSIHQCVSKARCSDIIAIPGHVRVDYQANGDGSGPTSLPDKQHHRQHHRGDNHLSQ